MRALLISLFLLTGFLFPQKGIDSVLFSIHWIPQAQFAGYYMAVEKGIYNKYNLEVKIIPAHPGMESSPLLEKDLVTFASLWLTNAMTLPEKGFEIVNIAQVLNRSALMLVAKKSSGIETLEDMNGHKMGIWGGDFSIQPLSFIENNNLDVEVITQGSSINLFLMDGVHLTSAMWYNEYHTILNSGLNPDELNTFFFADYGLNFPEEGIYCKKKTYDENYELCERFIAASLEGWKYAFEHPEETIDIVVANLRAAKYPANKAHEGWMLKRMKDLIFPEGIEEGFGILSKKDYDFVGEKLLEINKIETFPIYESFYKPIRIEK